jgi:hypothetical protein
MFECRLEKSEYASSDFNNNQVKQIMMIRNASQSLSRKQ